MSISTAKMVQVAFDEAVPAFEDMLIVAREVDKFTLPGGAQEQARFSDKVWRRMPSAPTVFDGFDQTANFGDITQLYVPVSVGQHKVVPIKYGPKDGRDQDSISKYMSDAGRALASQVNLTVFNTAVANASIVSKRTVASSGFDDLAAMSAIFTEQGVNSLDRKAFYSARDYLGMASQIAKPGTSNNELATTAYERAYIRAIGGFKLFENDQSYPLAAATATTVTITNTQPLYYTPVAATTDANGNTTNVDNRYQTISIAVGGSTVKVGDRFTIAGVNSIHHESKQSTGQLKTFTVTAIVTGAGGTGTIQITPPIISGGGATRAELDYKNVAATPANGAVITFLNTVAANANLFFAQQAIELIPGTYAINPDDGWRVAMRGTTPKLGLPMTLTAQGEINDLSVKMRLETDFGVGVLNTEMVGIQLFNQT